MNIKYFAPRWGFDRIAWEPFLQLVKDAGYSGIEWFPFGETALPADHQQVVKLLNAYDLEFVIVMAVLQQYDDVDEYLSALEQQLRYLCTLTNGDTRPLFITAQTGREYYTGEQVEKILFCCQQITDQTGIRIFQETHRNKWAFAAHAVAPLLAKHDDLCFTFDISHWFCVSESYLEDQQDTVDQTIRQSCHIHARVGHTQGPQVYDPALPEYAEALEAHLVVWDKYVRQRKADGAAYCTITPEFGPPPYMVFANRQGSAEDEQWRLNLWIKNHLETRFSHFEL